MYLDQKELAEELLKYKEQCTFTEKGKIKKRSQISPRLGKMIFLLVEGLSNRGNWSGYTWKEDMVGEGILTIIKYCHNFTEGNNAHAYLSKIAENTFKQYIAKQKNHSLIKDKLHGFESKIEDEYMNKSLDYQNFNI